MLMDCLQALQTWPNGSTGIAATACECCRLLTCVVYCSTSLKKPPAVPCSIASWNKALPSSEEKATAGGVGSARL